MSSSSNVPLVSRTLLRCEHFSVLSVLCQIDPSSFASRRFFLPLLGVFPCLRHYSSQYRTSNIGIIWIGPTSLSRTCRSHSTPPPHLSYAVPRFTMIDLAPRRNVALMSTRTLSNACSPFCVSPFRKIFDTLYVILRFRRPSPDVQRRFPCILLSHFARQSSAWQALQAIQLCPRRELPHALGRPADFI